VDKVVDFPSLDINFHLHIIYSDLNHGCCDIRLYFVTRWELRYKANEHGKVSNTHQSIDQSINQLTNQPINRFRL